MSRNKIITRVVDIVAEDLTKDAVIVLQRTVMDAEGVIHEDYILGSLAASNTYATRAEARLAAIEAYLLFETASIEEALCQKDKTRTN